MTENHILITGGCGFIGTNLVLELVKAGHRHVTVLDVNVRNRLDPQNLRGARVEMVEMDIRSPELQSLLAHRGVTAVVHLAGIHYIPYCNRNPSEAWSVNVDGTQAVLDAAMAAGVRNFFMASTAAVYKSAPGPHSEDDPLEPMDIYGETKFENEKQVRAAAARHSCKFVIGRIFNVVGAYETNPHLIPAIVERLKVSRKIEIGNPGSKRDYVHARDVSRAIIGMIGNGSAPLDVCNIGTGKAFSPPEVIDRLAKVIGETIEFNSSGRYQRQVDRPMLRADNSRLRRNYGWEQCYDLDAALADAVAYAAKSAPIIDEGVG